VPDRLASRLYAILDVEAARRRGLAPVAVGDAWLRAGVRVIQLRTKTLPTGEWLELTDALVGRTRPRGATLIVNDRADLARMAGAEGVHVGQQDLSPADVRTVAGPDLIVGLSTHTLEEIVRAVDEPIDYLAVGAVYPSSTKGPDHPVGGLELVRRAAAAAGRRNLPVVAIGGITLDTAPEVLEAGAAAVAVIADLLVGDPGERARQYLRSLGELTL
jgi:thiamine-phosphate pyrophosphorylase